MTAWTFEMFVQEENKKLYHYYAFETKFRFSLAHLHMCQITNGVIGDRYRIVSHFVLIPCSFC